MDLFNLVELSLGSQANAGIVNFNYLHELLLQIVQRLSYERPTHTSLVSAADSQMTLADTRGQGAPQPVAVSGGTTEGDMQGPSEVSLPSGSLSTETTPEHTKLRQQGGGSALSRRGIRSGMSIVSAANDLGALERKLMALECRVNTMESLGELLEKRASDKEATPVKDMWNFTLLTNKITSAEQGVEKVHTTDVIAL